MKWIMRGLTIALLCVGTFGALGCEASNETEADRLTKTAGDPGKPDPKGLPKETQPPAKTQQEQYKRQMQRQMDMFRKGSYPGKR